MAKIAVLPPQVANMIAAGEVVERPASVVKELMENAIDAGARAVTVEIRNGGVTYLRVTDDGCGMEPEDARTAFLRHATSKIRGQADLDAIGTLGFRGEALAAIAAVSRVDLFTKTAHSPLGTHLVLEGGQVLEEEETGCPDGTTILIKDLFFNTPARMKFLKKDSTEASYVEASVEHVALAHPELAVKFIKDGKEGLYTPGDGSMFSVIYAIYGKDFTRELTALSGSQRDVQVGGYVTRPTYSRANRSMQNFFVNGRFIRSKLLSAAVEQAYHGRFTGGRYPACFWTCGSTPAPWMSTCTRPSWRSNSPMSGRCSARYTSSSQQRWTAWTRWPPLPGKRKKLPRRPALPPGNTSLYKLPGRPTAPRPSPFRSKPRPSLWPRNPWRPIRPKARPAGWKQSSRPHRSPRLQPCRTGQLPPRAAGPGALKWRSPPRRAWRWRA